MIKKNILVISLLFFLNSCGFQPIYSKNNNVNFSIEQVDFTGDRELNNFIKTNLYQYKNSDNNNKIFIEAKSEYNMGSLIDYFLLLGFYHFHIHLQMKNK